MIDFLAWIINHAQFLFWILICMAAGGLFTPRFAPKTSLHAEIDSWVGAFLGLTVAVPTYEFGLLDTLRGWIIGLVLLTIVLVLYWFGVLPRTTSAPRPKNRFVRSTFQRYTFHSLIGQFLSHLILLTWSLVVLVPLWTMLVNSMKEKRAIFRSPFDLPTDETRTFDGFRNAWVDGNFDLYFKNSIMVTVTSLILILVLGALAAYALSNWRSRLSSGVYLYFVAGLMVPIRLGTINIVTIVQDLGLQGNLLALIPIYVAMGLPIAVFILTAFMRGVPHDLIDAARIDGASEFRVFWQIMVPLTRPALATVATFNMIPIWNDLWFPLILTRSENVRTVTYGVSLLFGQYQTDWTSILSILSLAAVPVLVLYLLLSKQFIKGLTAGAVKG
jgi:raffinose/stachyose/melibiose transport system permease protein